MRSLVTGLCVAAGGLAYYILVVAVEMSLKVDVAALFGTWSVWPILEYLPFVIGLRFIKLGLVTRVISVVYVVSIGMAVAVIGAWGMEGLEAAMSNVPSAIPVISIFVLILFASLPLRGNNKARSG